MKKLCLTIIILGSVVFARNFNNERPILYKSYTATAYCQGTKTASGERVREGLIAADTRLLPFGTKVYIPGLGVFKVSDTGGAIKNNIIDVYMSSCQAARKFGRKKINLKVIA